MNHQTIASDPNISAFVMASAGTGKTKMLVDRLTRLLLRGIKISSILCLTFTKAAAQEMVHRLFNRLESYTKMDDESLQKVLEDLDESEASLEKTRNLYFELLDLQHTLKIQTIHSFCQSILEANAWSVGITPPFSLIDDDQKKQLIEKCLDKCAEDIKVFTSFMSYSTFIEYVENALSLPEDAIKKSVTPLPLPLVNDDLENLLDQLPDAIKETVDANTFLTKESLIRKRIFKKAELEKFPYLEELSQNIAQAYLQKIDCEKTKQLNNLNAIFFSFIEKVQALYIKEKEKRSLLDFDDLITKTNLLLKNSPEVEQKLGYSIESILLDEAQDTSAIQWEVLTTLTECMLLQDSPHSSLFVVGDLKQSIYSFQGAEPALFLEKQKDFNTLFTHYHKPFKVLTLQRSYRCSYNVLKSVDTLFNKHPDGLFLSESLHHIPHRQIHGHIHIHPLKTVEKNTSWQLPIDRAEEETLSNDIANFVEDLLAKNIKPKDILILVRSRSAYVDQLIKLFSHKNIPCSGLDRFYLKDHPMTTDFLNLLEWLVNKTQTWFLFHVLKTFNAMTDETLYNMIKKEQSLWMQLDPEDAFTQFLKTCLSKVDYCPLTELISFIWQKQKTYFVQTYGLEADAIFETFYDLTYKVEQEQSATLQELVWAIKTQPHEVKRDVSGNTLNQIRILTVHGSKGLEAPTVILADTNFRQTLQKERLIRYLDRYLIKPSDADCPSFLKSVKEQALMNLKAEEKRLLYVALTRARDNLYIFGKGNLVDGSWYDLLSTSIQLKDAENTLNVVPQSFKIDTQKIDVPEYFKTPIVLEKEEASIQTEATERGTLIHKAIEILSPLSTFDRSLKAQKLIEKKLIIQDDLNNIFYFFEHYPHFFNDNNFFELPLIEDGKLYRVDLFIKQESKGIIIDFKTGNRTEHKRTHYTQQIKIYQRILEKIYPTLSFENYLFWIDEQKVDLCS